MSEKYGIMEKGCGNLRDGAGKATEVQENTGNQGRGKLQDIPWVQVVAESQEGPTKIAQPFMAGFAAQPPAQSPERDDRVFRP